MVLVVPYSTTGYPGSKCNVLLEDSPCIPAFFGPVFSQMKWFKGVCRMTGCTAAGNDFNFCECYSIAHSCLFSFFGCHDLFQSGKYPFRVPDGTSHGKTIPATIPSTYDDLVWSLCSMLKYSLMAYATYLVILWQWRKWTCLAMQSWIELPQ